MAFFGLSLDAVRIGGGLLVAASGWRLLNSDPDSHVEAPVDPSDDLISSRAFYPLTFPLTCGPGSISVALTLGAGIFSEGMQIDERSFATLAGLLIVSALVYLCYRSAPRLGGLIGRTGSIVMLRRDAPQAPIPVPEWKRAAAYAVARNAAQRPRPTLAYSKRKMVLTKGSTLNCKLVARLIDACSAGHLAIPAAP